MMLNNGYQPCITGPTKIINGKKPSIVEIIVSNSVEACISGNILNNLTKYLPIFVIVENVTNNPRETSQEQI